MAYQIYKFDDVLLPVGNNTQEHAPGIIESKLIDSVGGVFDYDGDYQRYPRRVVVPITGLYTGERANEVDESSNRIVDESGNYIVTHGAEVDLRVQIEALQKKIGKRASLWRRYLSDTSVEQWKTARLARVPWAQSYRDGAIMAELSCVFETQHAGWRAETRITTQSGGCDSATQRKLTIHNGGSMRVDDAIIRIWGDSTTSQSVRFVNQDTGIDLTYTGAIGDAQAVIIDCGKGTVKFDNSDPSGEGDGAPLCGNWDYDGADRYSGLSLNSGHTARGWFPLEPGNNAITVISDNTPGSLIYICVGHYNQWP